MEYVMPSLHLFNPGHETAILHGSGNYTPSINVQRMTRELSTLPVWYADSNDFVYSEETNVISLGLDWFEKSVRPISAEALIREKDILPSLTVRPWGLSPHSCGFFKRLSLKGVPLILPQWKEDYKVLAGRQTAARCLSRLKDLLPEMELPVVPHFCNTIEEAKNYVDAHEQTEFVLKSPFSSSGRGILWIKRGRIGRKEEQWMSGILKKQSVFSIEPALGKVCDFAIEFYSDGKGHVRYEGLSLFSTAAQGAYCGNFLGEQDDLLHQLAQYGIVEKLTLFKEKLKEVLKEEYASIYEGFLGVDMLVYQISDDEKFCIHPCVEINMRYTMGLVALQLSKKLLAEGSRGHFAITYNNKPEGAYRKYCEMREQFPLIIEKNKVVSGYLSLCPMAPQNGYMAYILVNPCR